MSNLTPAALKVEQPTAKIGCHALEDNSSCCRAFCIIWHSLQIRALTLPPVASSLRFQYWLNLPFGQMQAGAEAHARPASHLEALHVHLSLWRTSSSSPGAVQSLCQEHPPIVRRTLKNGIVSISSLTEECDEEHLL